MANKNHFEYFNGKCKWCRAVQPDQKFKIWSVDIYPDAESLAKFRALQDEGVLTRLKKNDDGEYFFKLSRPTAKIMKGNLVNFTAPVVMDKDGNTMDGMTVGNGSDVTAKVHCYYYPKPTGGFGKAIRWEALKVLNLVPFNVKQFPEGSMEAVQTENLKEQPEPLW